VKMSQLISVLSNTRFKKIHVGNMSMISR
jgi:hypothetical protein